MSVEPPRRKRVPGWVLVVMVLIIVATQLPRGISVERVYCDEKYPLPAMRNGETTVNGKPIPDVLMIGSTACPYCKQATQYFSENNISFCEFNIDTSSYARMLYDRMQVRATPLIFIGDDGLVGFEEAKASAALRRASLLK